MLIEKAEVYTTSMLRSRHLYLLTPLQTFTDLSPPNLATQCSSVIFYCFIIKYKYIHSSLHLIDQIYFSTHFLSYKDTKLIARESPLTNENMVSFELIESTYFLPGRGANSNYCSLVNLWFQTNSYN